MKHPASAAQRAADADLSRRGGIDETEEARPPSSPRYATGSRAACRPSADGSLAPRAGDVRLDRLQVGRRGYDRLTNLDPGRKVRCRRRKGAEGGGGHSARRGRRVRGALSADMRDAAWGWTPSRAPRGDSACLPTLLHRPTSFQLAPLTPSQDSASTVRAPRSVASAPGRDGMRGCSGTAVADDSSGSPTGTASPRPSAAPRRRRGCSTAIRGGPARRGPARRTAWRSARCRPRGAASPSTGSRGRLRAAHVARQLGAEGQARVHDAAPGCSPRSSGTTRPPSWTPSASRRARGPSRPDAGCIGRARAEKGATALRLTRARRTYPAQTRSVALSLEAPAADGWPAPSDPSRHPSGTSCTWGNAWEGCRRRSFSVSLTAETRHRDRVFRWV